MNKPDLIAAKIRLCECKAAGKILDRNKLIFLLEFQSDSPVHNDRKNSPLSGE